MLAADEAAKRHAERHCERREDAFVSGFAGLEQTNRARRDAGFRCQIVGAVAARDAKAEDAR